MRSARSWLEDLRVAALEVVPSHLMASLSSIGLEVVAFVLARRYGPSLPRSRSQKPRFAPLWVPYEATQQGHQVFSSVVMHRC